jgi:uncharacterized protein YcnI
MKRFSFVSVFFVLCFCFGFATIADAHVTVWPKNSEVGAWEKYTVRVPSEKESSTIKIQLDFPKNVSVETVQPLADWDYQFIKGSDGRNKGIVWTAKGDGIKAHEFLEFTIIGANPKQATNVSWNAHQTYSDGSIVNWTGKPGSDKPASVTKISGKSTAMDFTPTTEPTDSVTRNEWVAIIIASVALLLSLITLFRKKG